MFRARKIRAEVLRACTHSPRQPFPWSTLGEVIGSVAVLVLGAALYLFLMSMA